MLKNYFRIAIAVLRRRKFFTFISLFGISLTLTFLIILTSFIDHAFSASYPDWKRERSLYINTVHQKNTEKGWSSSGPASFYFLNTYARTLKTPEKVSISSIFTHTNTYVNNKKLLLNVKFTNAEFWDVLEFKFIDGKPFGEGEIKRKENVAVITEETKKQYFGNVGSVIGKYIETDNKQYRVIGVVKNVPITNVFAYSDLYLPYSLPKSGYQATGLNGSYTAILLARNKSDLKKIKDEFRQTVSKIRPPNEKEFDKLSVFADSYLEGFTRDGSDTSRKSLFILITGLFVFLFMLLPTINLININVSRIMERSSEIGVRKAFGASPGKLVIQFLVENLLLTLIGGLLGIFFSLLIMYIINNSGWIPNIDLTMNLKVLIISLMLCILFGFISGVYPAWKMSRLSVVNALKAG